MSYLLSGLCLTQASPLLARPAQTLFVIKRSKNRNIVYFDLPSSGVSGQIPDKNEPLEVYWRLFEEDGRTEPLSWLERSLAYGYTVVRSGEGGAVLITLKACTARPIRIESSPRPRAVMDIGGVPSVLREVRVAAEEGRLIPRVLHVDLVGTQISSGLPARERLLP